MRELLWAVVLVWVYELLIKDEWMNNVALPFSLSSVSNLHDRWSNNCRRYRDLYKQSLELDLSPQFNWTQLLAAKQVRTPSALFLMDNPTPWWMTV